MLVSSMACAMITAATVVLTGDQNSHALGGFIGNLTAVEVLLYAVVMGPLVEELAFRLPLKVGKWSLAYGLSFLALFVFVIFFQAKFDLPAWWFDYIDWRGVASIAGTTTLVALLLMGLFQIEGVYRFIQAKLTRYYAVYFYSILGSFAAIHILNFDDVGEIWFVAPLLILPQLSLSFFTSFIRLKMGFIWAYLAHFLNNGLMIGLILAMFNISPTLVEAMSDFDFTRLQFLSATELLLLGVLNVIFFTILTVALFNTLKLLGDYWKSRAIERTNRLKFARLLNSLIPGMGHDYLGQSKAAKQYYRALAAITFLLIVPMSIPFTYVSVAHALGMYALPTGLYIWLTYHAVGRLKVVPAPAEATVSYQPQA